MLFTFLKFLINAYGQREVCVQRMYVRTRINVLHLSWHIIPFQTSLQSAQLKYHIVVTLYSSQAIAWENVGSQFNSLCGQQILFFSSLQAWFSGPPGIFEAGKCGRDVKLTTEPPPSSDSKNEWNYTSTPSLCLQGIYKGNFNWFVCLIDYRAKKTLQSYF